MRRFPVSLLFERRRSDCVRQPRIAAVYTKQSENMLQKTDRKDEWKFIDTDSWVSCIFHWRNIEKDVRRLLAIQKGQVTR